MLRRVSFVSFALALSTLALTACRDKEVVDVPGSMSGKACALSDRQGIANINVEVRLIDGDFTARAPTNGNGEFTFASLNRGAYDVFALLADNTEQQVNAPNVPVEVVPNNRASIIDARCGDRPDVPDSGEICGEVCNRHTGELVSEATVTVLAADQSVVGSGVTDSEGRFCVADVVEGDHVLSIRADGFGRSFPVTVKVDETVVLDLNEGTCGVPFGTGCTILGSLCNPDGPQGAKLAGARVTVSRVGAAADEVDVDVTDTAGEFYISALLPGAYDINIASTDPRVNQNYFAQECVAGQETVIVGPDACADRTPIGRLQGRLCDLIAFDGYFTGAVKLVQGGVVKYETATAADGRFAFDVLDVGTYDVQLGDPIERIYSTVVVNAFQTTIIEEATCPTPDDVCVNFTHTPAVASDGRILFVVDRSGSMRQASNDFGNINKWDALRNTLETVTTSLASSVSYGLFVYPDPADDTRTNPPANCSAGVQRLAMGGTAAAINAALDAVLPNGGTPTSATLSAVVPVVRGLVADQRPLAVVLATDGAPNCKNNPVVPIDDEGFPEVLLIPCICTSNLEEQTNASCASFNCLDEQVSTNTGPITELARLGVQTHVVGIPDVGGNVNAETAAIFTSSLNAMAVAGGAPLSGSVKFHDGSNTAALQRAMESITRRILACQIVTDFDLNGATSLEVRLGDAALAKDTNQRNGWNQTGARSIELFGSACDAATLASVNVVVRRCARP